MNNWCTNQLTMEGNEKDIKEVLDFVKGADDQIIDLNKITPVPVELQKANV